MLKMIAQVVGVLLWSFGVLSCGSGAPEPQASGKMATVSIVPSVTELVFAAGGGDHLVGVTHYCDYPEETKQIAKVGDLRMNSEILISLAPDIVFSNDEVAAKNNVDIERLGIRVERMEAQSLEDMLACVLRIGVLLNCEAKSEFTVEEMRRRIAVLDAKPRGEASPLVIFISTLDPLWLPGAGSHVDHLIQRAGGSNIAGEKAWARLPWEMVLKLNPDILLVAGSELGSLESRAGWNQLKAVVTGRVHLVEEDLFARMTPRSIDGYEQLIHFFHER